MTRSDRILDIECLRAVAIGYTLLAHYRFSYPAQPAWITWLDGRAQFWGGVDLFFVISGFVISKNLIPQLRKVADHPEARIKVVLSFWLRRVYRLWPSSWLWALLVIPLVAIGARDQLMATIYDVVAAILQVSNFHAKDCGAGAICSPLVMVGVYWSLSLEEQFYIFLPLLFFFLRDHAKWALIALLCAGVISSWWWPGQVTYFRWEGFCMGVLLAWAYANPRLHGWLDSYLVAGLGRFTVAASVLMLIAIPLIAHGGIASMTYALTAACSAVLVWLASFDKNYLGIPALLRRPMVYLGSRSYSIYLIQMPVFVLFRWSWDPTRFESAELATRIAGHVAWCGAVTAVMIALAELNFRFVEARFRLPSSRAVALK